MCINKENEYLVSYRVYQDFTQAAEPNVYMINQQEYFESQKLIERLDGCLNYKLTLKGSDALLEIFDAYNEKLREILISNRKVHRKSQRTIKVSQIIQDLGLDILNNNSAEEWVEYFIYRLTVDGYFSRLPMYSEVDSEIRYYCNTNE